MITYIYPHSRLSYLKYLRDYYLKKKEAKLIYKKLIKRNNKAKEAKTKKLNPDNKRDQALFILRNERERSTRLNHQQTNTSKQ